MSEEPGAAQDGTAQSGASAENLSLKLIALRAPGDIKVFIFFWGTVEDLVAYVEPPVHLTDRCRALSQAKPKAVYSSE